MHDGILIIENCKIQKAYYHDGLCKQKYCSSDKILERIGLFHVLTKYCKSFQSLQKSTISCIQQTVQLN